MSHAHTSFPARIVRDPDILVGKPVIRGTRISVEVVLDYLAHTPDFPELFADYPRLTIEDVQACLEYAQGLVTAEDEDAQQYPVMWIADRVAARRGARRAPVPAIPYDHGEPVGV